MSDTGGGHRASAEALMAELESQQARCDLDVSMVDLWKHHTPNPINRIPDTYSFLVNRTPWLWWALWQSGDSPMAARWLHTLTYPFAKRPIQRYFAATRPDLVVSVHPLLQSAPYQALRSLGSKVPFATVVTDLASAHVTWFHPRVDAVFVASEEAEHRAVRSNVDRSRIRRHGLPVRPEFAEAPPERGEARAARGFDPRRPLVLVMGGGEGMGRVGDIARALDHTLGEPDAPAIQMVVVCGRNRELEQSLRSREWRIPTAVLGFVDDVAGLMAAADLIVTKAGPGTIAEALTRGLPILLSGYVPGQEEGNIRFVVQGGVGEYCDEPAEIAATVARWLGPDRARLDAMSDAARRLAEPEATKLIANDLLQLLEGHTISRETPPRRS